MDKPIVALMDDNFIWCRSCGYRASIDKWSRIKVTSPSGQSYLVCREYSLIKKELIHRGSVDLLACPDCRTIQWIR